MCSADDCPRTLVSLGTDQRKLLAAMSSVAPKGTAHVLQSLKVAQIILKTRPNPNQRQRIVLFIASPLQPDHIDPAALLQLGKQLRKNGVAVDVVGLAGNDNPGNARIIEPFIDAVNVGAELDDGERVSRFLDVPSGESVLDAVNVHLAGATTAAQGMAQDYEDAEEMDPELAMALKMSLEEEMARQAKDVGGGAGASEDIKNNNDDEGGKEDKDVDMDDPELARAIAMSLEKP
jgi:26S proteasome regulatory subunit N10